jgi:MPBQ/MSBQ methyltransferase
MFDFLLPLFLFVLFLLASYIIWKINARKFISSGTVASAYDAWTNDKLLERLWGEHIHLGFYQSESSNIDFRKAKVQFVHELVKWSGLNKLPKGSRILDVGCGIGGSSRILAKHYGFNVTGITISPAQVKRARELTPSGLNCNFQVMDALDLKFEDGSFDAVWSVEAGAHMKDKKRFADEMLRTLRPGGYLALADWNSRDLKAYPPSLLEKLVLKQLLEQWVHPNFISINEFSNILSTNKNSAGKVTSENWNSYTNPSWYDSIIEGIRRPYAILSLGPLAIVKSIREIPTILLMNWAFRKGLMEFGVYKCRG